MSPPFHAVVVSIAEKSQIQALDRTQPRLLMRPGKCGAMTRDYKRNGTTTLLAALNAGECAVRPCRIIHAIADTYATHKHPKVKAARMRHSKRTKRFFRRRNRESQGAGSG
jgi:hypothetical protein